MITIRSFVVLGLSLVLGLAIFGVQIGRAVRMGREFDRYLSVRGLSEREVKATLVIWPIRCSVAAEQLSALRIQRARLDVFAKRRRARWKSEIATPPRPSGRSCAS
jgi:hypothetical protein